MHHMEDRRHALAVMSGGAQVHRPKRQAYLSSSAPTSSGSYQNMHGECPRLTNYGMRGRENDRVRCRHFVAFDSFAAPI